MKERPRRVNAGFFVNGIGVFTVKSEQILHIVLVFPLLTLSKYITAGSLNQKFKWAIITLNSKFTHKK